MAKKKKLQKKSDSSSPKIQVEFIHVDNGEENTIEEIRRIRDTHERRIRKLKVELKEAIEKKREFESRIRF